MSAPIVFSYLNAMTEHKASDLYLTVGFPPTLRAENVLIPVGESLLDPESIVEIIGSILTNRQKRDFEAHQELNTALDMGKHGRYRINVMQQKQVPALVIRRIISNIPSFEELHLPPIFQALSLERRGLVLITGMTGSGKSTTLASMIDYRNKTTQGHIITIEDPVEYYHEHRKCIVSQREVGVDTESYAVAMKNALRQRPDVILVGEIRDREVMEQALTIAETGHLCLATLHTNNSYQAIERIVNFFPEEMHAQVRLNLAMNLRAIVSQRLIPSTAGNLVIALEIMINESLVRELIHEGKVSKIREVMEQNRTSGMCTFDRSLFRLYREGKITPEVAISQADQPGDLKIKIQQAMLGGDAEESALHAMDTSVLSFSD